MFIFFVFKVMDETNTQIAWPSKLKIGAKSKKGIHTHTVVMRKVVALVTRHEPTICLQAAASHRECGYIHLVFCCHVVCCLCHL